VVALNRACPIWCRTDKLKIKVMAYYNENSQFSFGKYKGKKVSEVNDAEYIVFIHESKYNIYFTEEVFNRLGIKHKGKIKLIKN